MSRLEESFFPRPASPDQGSLGNSNSPLEGLEAVAAAREDSDRPSPGLPEAVQAVRNLKALYQGSGTEELTGVTPCQQRMESVNQSLWQTVLDSSSTPVPIPPTEAPRPNA